MRTIANTAAQADILINSKVTGLEGLMRANDLVEKIHHNAAAMRDMQANVTTHVTGLDKIKSLFHVRNNLGHPITSTVDVKANTMSVDQMTHKIHVLQGWLNKAHDVHVDADDSQIKQTQNAVDNLRAKVKSARNSFTGSNDTVNDSLGSVNRHITGLGHKTETLGGRARRVGHAFKAAFTGGIVANFASSAWNAAKTVTKAGWALNMAGAKAKVTWSHIGLSSGQTNAMVGQMDRIRDSSDMDEQSINSLQKRFYTLTGSAGQARSLTNEITAFGKASGDSNQEVDRLGMTLPRMLSASKVRGQMFNRTFSHAPAMVDALAKASGRSKKSFLALVDSGKMTGAQLKQYLSGAAKYSGKSWDEYTKTAGGRIAYVKGLAREAESSATKGLTGSFVKGLSAIGRNNKNLNQVRKSLGQISNQLGRKVGNFAGKAISYIIKNQKPLMRIGSALFKIVGIMAKGIWKEFTGILSLFDRRSHKSGSGLNSVANALSAIARHKTALKVIANLMVIIYARKKYMDMKRDLGFDNRGVTSLAKHFKTLLLKIKSTTAAQKAFKAVSTGFRSVVGVFKTFFLTLRSGTGIQTALNVAMDANPIGAVIVGVTALTVGLVELYKHCRVAREVMNAIGRVGVAAFKGIWNGIKAVGKLAWAVIKWYFKPWIPIIRKLGSVAKKIFHGVGGFAHGVAHKAGHFIGGLTDKINGSTRKTTRSTRRAMSKTATSTRGYLSKSGKYYKHYHKGLTRMSKASFKAQQRMRSRDAQKSQANLRKYERSYRKYQRKRNSLGRKYGKLRAMYSVRSLKVIEKRFKRLRRDILKETKSMYRGTRRDFRRIGKGAGKQFKGIYRSTRRWLTKSTRLQKRDYRTMSRNSRRLLNGAVKSYIRILKRRFKSQRYYDRQLIKQTKRTNTIMKKLPLAWVTKETKDLISNWRRQRRSYVVHNTRMTHALVTHIHTMSHHLRNFKDSAETIFSDMESNVEKGFSKFFDNLHDIAGKGMNSVQAPLNTGAQHLNGFVSAFGETTPPLHSMPTISYATGTGALSALAGVSGLRRPITQLTSAVLNDDSHHGQETVVHPDGKTEKPQGANVHATLRPGDEVLNASETRLMDAISKPVHLANGTGFFSNLKKFFTGGSTGSVSQSSLLAQAKDKGKQRLLNELQNVIKSPGKILSGMFGAKPNGGKGVLGDIINGVYSLGGQQAGQWWTTLIGQINQELNDDAGGVSNSKALNYAMKIGRGKPYKWGGNGPGGYDCSGLVRAVLDKFGVTKGGRVAGSEINAFPHISRDQAKPGDLVGNHDHIGIVSDNGARHYYSAFNYSQGIKNFPLDQDHWTSGDSTMIFSRVPEIAKANGGNSDSDAEKALKSVKTNGAIGSFVKKQMDPMEKWIEKNLVPLMDPNPTGPGVKKWIPIIHRAAEMTHSDLSPHLLSLILGTIQNESGGNAKINGINDNDGTGAAKGLLQYKNSTFDAYAYPGHHNIMSGLDQMLAFFNSTNYKTALVAHDSANGKNGGEWSPAHGSGPSGGRRFAKGGRFKAGELMTVGEHGQELIKPDFSGEVIPHGQSKHIINNSSKPVSVSQHVTINVKDGSRQSAKKIVDVMHQYGDKLADKFNGGDFVY